MMATPLMVSRMLYPNFLYPSYFTEGWGFFFSQEIYNLSVFFSLLFAAHYLWLGFHLVCVVVNVAAVILIRRILAGGFCTSSKKLDGQTVIVTGSNVGIGKETARDMARRGARVIMACRDLKKGEAARLDLVGEGGLVELRKLDLSSLESVRKFAAGIIKDNIKVHILINNAGVMMCPYMETTDGFEMQMGTNHLGHFLLTNLLLPQMRHGQPARIINVSSLGHLGGNLDFLDDMNYKKGYDKNQAYFNSKLANVLFTRHLAHKLKGTNIQVFSVHPGAVQSDLARHLITGFMPKYVMPLFLKTTMEGAQTTIYCAIEAHQHPDMYFSDAAVGWPLAESKDEAAARRLWDISEKLVKLNTK